MDHTDSSRKKIKIMLLATSLGAGGAEKQLIYLANYLASDYRVQIMTLNSDLHRIGEIDTQVCFSSANIFGEKYKTGNMYKFSQTLKALKSSDASLIITFSYHAMLLVWFSRMIPGASKIPIVVSERSNDMGSWSRRVSRILAYRKASMITANSQSALAEIRRLPYLAGKKMRLTPNYLERANPMTTLRGDDSSNELFTWTCVARLSEEKNHMLLLSAARLMKDAGHEFRLQLVGDGPLRIQIQATIIQLDLSDRVFLMGTRRDVPAILSSSDAFVLTSNYEGMPNAAMEAGLLSLPIATTNAGDIGSLLSAKCQRFIADSWEPVEVARVMTSMMSLSENELSILGESNRVRIEHLFCNEGNLRVWNEIIGEAIQETN